MSNERTFEEQAHFMSRQAQMLAEEGNDVSSGVMQEALQMLTAMHAELEQSQDIRSTMEIELSLVADGLGVEHEPHQTFMERLLEASCSPGCGEADTPDKARLEFAEQKAATIYCSESGHWVFVNERAKTRTGCIGVGIRGCIDAAMMADQDRNREKTCTT